MSRYNLADMPNVATHLAYLIPNIADKQDYQVSNDPHDYRCGPWWYLLHICHTHGVAQSLSRQNTRSLFAVTSMEVIHFTGCSPDPAK